MNHVDSAALRSDEKSDRPHDPVFYAETLNRLLDLPACVGYHLCGGYLKNIGVLSVSLRKPVPIKISFVPAGGVPMSVRYQAVAQSPIC